MKIETSLELSSEELKLWDQFVFSSINQANIFNAKPVYYDDEYWKERDDEYWKERGDVYNDLYNQEYKMNNKKPIHKDPIEQKLKQIAQAADFYILLRRDRIKDETTTTNK